MFEDKFKKELEEIKADDFIKQKVLAQMEYAENKKTLMRRYALRSCVACTLVIVLIVSIFSFNKLNNVDTPTIAPVDNNAGPKATYDEIFEKIDGLNSIQARDDSEMITEDFALYENTTATGAAKGDAAEDVGTSTNANADMSDTNEQVEGVDEADIVKTDGKYIYIYSQKLNEISIVKAGKDAKKVASIEFDNIMQYYINEMFVQNGKLVFLTRVSEQSEEEKSSELLTDDRIYPGGRGNTAAIIYDIENPEKPKMVYKCIQSGDYNTSRLIGDNLYILSNYLVDTYNVKKDEYDTYIPTVIAENVSGPVSADSICIAKEITSPVYTVICGYNIRSGEMLGTQSVLGGTNTVYCSNKNIITASYYNGDDTKITRYSLNNGDIKLEAETEIKGSLLNQFSIDEHNGYFRFVTTESTGVETREDNVVSYTMTTVNSLKVLDKDLKEVGKIENVAPDERVYSVRFMGDVAYFVTFRQVDPLFSVDLSNPKEPKIIGKLKIPGFSNYLFPFGEGKLLGIGQDANETTGRTGGIKFSIFDISDPSNVTESAKTILKYSDSDALYNHKAALVDTKRNLIGIQVWWQGKMQYNLYTYKNDGFEPVMEFVFSEYSDFLRGLYIGNEFYVVTDSAVLVHDINTFDEITTVEL